MKEAVHAFILRAFDAFDLIRIYAEPFANNLASVRVLENAAFMREGRLQAHVLKDGEVLDAFLYARVRLPKTAIQ